jgi:hypothetical protein
MFSFARTIDAQIESTLPSDVQLQTELTYESSGLTPNWSSKRVAMEHAKAAANKLEEKIQQILLERPDLGDWNISAAVVTGRSSESGGKSNLALPVLLFENDGQKAAAIVCGRQHYSAGGMVFNGPNPFRSNAVPGTLSPVSLGF